MVVLLTFKLHNTVTTNLTSLYTNDVLSVLACVGRFGDHCNKTCPEGHYGIGCNNKCACDNNLCDKVLGCPIIATENGNLFPVIDKKRRYLRIILHLALSLSAFITVVLVGVLLRIAYRLKRGEGTRNDRSNGTNVGNMMMADSSAVYAAVVCTNRTPIQGVQQNDEMYGNIIMLHEQNGKH
nr:uncharacterized protein LOC105323742 [Crassostrea gigas]